MTFDASTVSWLREHLFDSAGRWSPGRHATLDGAMLPDGDMIDEFEARHRTGNLPMEDIEHVADHHRSDADCGERSRPVELRV